MRQNRSTSLSCTRFQRPLQTLRCRCNVVTWDGRAWQVANIGGNHRRAARRRRERCWNFRMQPWSHLSSRAASHCRPKPPISAHAERFPMNSFARVRTILESPTTGPTPSANISPETIRSEAAVPARTLRRWVARYRAAETQFGAGYVGLLPRTAASWEFQRAACQNFPLRLMNEVIESDYETVKQKSRIASWATLERDLQTGTCSDAQLHYLLSGGAQQESNLSRL